MKTSLSKGSKRGFSLIELLTVIAIMTIMTGLIVSTHMGTRPAGARQGAISQLMGSLEEARMSAIEKSTPVYFGIADTSFPDSDKQLRSYILFRDQTTAEKAASQTADKVPLSRWETLPNGFYFDPSKLPNQTDGENAAGLPGNPTTVRAVKFGSLGQVLGVPAANALGLTVVEGRFVNETVTPTGGGDFFIAVSRLTGRLQFNDAEPQTP